MKAEESSSPQVVEEARAARLLVDWEQVRPLLPFMGRERSVGQAAQELGLPLDAMTYRVKRLVRLGLLRELRQEPRKGRAIRYYHAQAAFFVPLSAVPAETTQALFAAADAALRDKVAASIVRALHEEAPFQPWGVLVRRQPSGQPDLGLVPWDTDWRFEHLLAPSAPAILSSWVFLRLEFGEAKALQQELFSLIAKYAERGGSQPYLLGLALAPAEERA